MVITTNIKSKTILYLQYKFRKSLSRAMYTELQLQIYIVPIPYYFYTVATVAITVHMRSSAGAGSGSQSSVGLGDVRAGREGGLIASAFVLS